MIEIQILVKTLKFKNCNIELENFNYPFDLYDSIKYKKIQVKYTSLIYGEWKVSSIKKNFDNLFLLCLNRGNKDVERV